MPLATYAYMLRVELALSSTIALTAMLVLIFTVGVLNTITAFFFQACVPLRSLHHFYTVAMLCLIFMLSGYFLAPYWLLKIEAPCSGLAYEWACIVDCYELKIV